MHTTRSGARLGAIGAIAAAAALAVALAAPAAAGGWASILIDHDASASTGRAGEPIEVTFSVLQHGVTPIDTEQATVVATEAGSGDVVRVAATALGDGGGTYRASLVLPHEGQWRWQVELGTLVAQSQYQDVAVAPDAAGAAAATGSSIDLLPALVVGIAGALLAAGALALVARAGRRRTSAGAAPTS